MRATITKIIDKQRYERLHFKGEDGKHYMTDLVSTFRNYSRWKPLIKVDNVLDGLKLMGKNKIDADSFPKLARKEESPQQEMKF